jgi:hypothetical protein
VRRFAACLLLTLCSLIAVSPTFARANQQTRLAQKSAKAQQKQWNKYVKKQQKEQKKAEKKMRKLNKRLSSGHGYRV